MKFSYEGANLGEIIRKYEVSDEMIAIYLLDRKNPFVIPYNTDVEQKIQECMIEQAKKRQERMNLNEYNKQLSNAVLVSLFGGVFSVFSTAGLMTAEQVNAQSYFGGLLVYTSSATILSSLIALKQNKKVKELKKYDIYLSISEQLNNVCDTRLYEGISSKRQNLNINTLDNYSLKELESIRDNLNKIMLDTNTHEDKKYLVKKKFKY